MTVIDRKSPASLIIAEVLSCDWDDVREMIYQPTNSGQAQMYGWDDNPWSYFCCPTKRQKLPKGYQWEIVGYSPFQGRETRPVYGVKYENLDHDS